MTETAFENVTKAKCRECGDKLTAWELESGLCLMCAPDTDNTEPEWDEWDN